MTPAPTGINIGDSTRLCAVPIDADAQLDQRTDRATPGAR
jgi:hypothetical protein